MQPEADVTAPSHCLDNVVKWLKVNNLKRHPDITEVMLVTQYGAPLDNDNPFQ